MGRFSPHILELTATQVSEIWRWAAQRGTTMPAKLKQAVAFIQAIGTLMQDAAEEMLALQARRCCQPRLTYLGHFILPRLHRPPRASRRRRPCGILCLLRVCHSRAVTAAPPGIPKHCSHGPVIARRRSNVRFAN